MVARPTLVGRTMELRTIDVVLRRRRRASAAIEVVGESGIGKTTLLDAAAARAAAIGHTVLRSVVTEAEQALPWAGMASLQPSLAPALDTLPEPQRDAILAAVGEAAPGPATAGPYVAAALRNIIRALATDAPLVLVVDDLQWADAATAGALAVAIRGSADRHLTVIAAHRQGLHPRIELGRVVSHDHRLLELGALGDADVQLLLDQRVGGRLSRSTMRTVARLSGGNPLYTVLLGEHAAASDAVDGLPRSIVASYARQLDALPEGTVEVLEHAAVLGRPEPRILAEVCPDRDVTAALHDAERAGLITGQTTNAMRFAHPLLPTTLTDRIGPLGRARIHRRLAGVVADPELRAVHLAAATTGPDAAVAAALDIAASGALAHGARIEAGERFERALALTPDGATADRSRRALAAGDAFLGGGDLERSACHARLAFDLAPGPVEQALAGAVLAQVIASRDGLHQAHDFVSELLARLVGVPLVRPFLYRAKVRLEQTFDLAAALATAVEMQEELAAADDEDGAAGAAVVAENCRFILGLPTDPLAAWQRARIDADPTDHMGVGWMGLEMLVWDLQVDAATAALDQFERQAEARGSMLGGYKVHDFRATLAGLRGELDVAERELRRAVDAAELTGYPASMSASGLARVLAATGRGEEAATVLATVERPADDLPLLAVAWHNGRAFVAFMAGRWEEAADHYDQAWAAADKVGMGDLRALPFRADAVEVLVRVGRIDDADRRATIVEELAARTGAPSALLQATRARLQVLLARGRYPEAIELAEARLAMPSSATLPTERCRILLALGIAQRRAGRRRDAAESLASAHALAVAAGLTPWTARIDDELARVGGRRDPYELTWTERQVAALVARGRSNREVASELVVSLRTVESNLTRIYRKLGVRSRAELAAGYRADDRRDEAGPS